MTPNLAIVTDQLQKIGFVSSGSVTVNRPDKLGHDPHGGFADVEMTFDGKDLGILGKNIDKYAKVPVTGTIDELIDTLREFAWRRPLRICSRRTLLSHDVECHRCEGPRQRVIGGRSVTIWPSAPTKRIGRSG